MKEQIVIQEQIILFILHNKLINTACRSGLDDLFFELHWYDSGVLDLNLVNGPLGGTINFVQIVLTIFMMI